MVVKQIAAVPQDFVRIHHSKACYMFYTCLNEFRRNIQEVKEHVNNCNSQSGREVVHQMITTAKLINEKRVTDIVLELQSDLRAEAWHQKPEEKVDKIEKYIKRIFIDLAKENPPIEVLILSDESNWKSWFLNYFEPNDQLNLLNIESDSDDIKNAVAKYLPDVLILSISEVGSKLEDDLEYVKMRYPGTVVLYENQVLDYSIESNAERLIDRILQSRLSYDFVE